MLPFNAFWLMPFAFGVLLTSASRPRVICQGSELQYQDVPTNEAYNFVFRNSSLRDDALTTLNQSNYENPNFLVYQWLPGIRVNLTRDELNQLLDDEVFSSGVKYIECDTLHFSDNNRVSHLCPKGCMMWSFLILSYLLVLL